MRDRFLAAAQDDSTFSVRDEPGCLRFDVLQDNADPDHFFFYEVYRDEAAFQAHAQAPTSRSGAKRLPRSSPHPPSPPVPQRSFLATTSDMT